MKETRITLCVLTALSVLACSREVRVPAATSSQLDSGYCAGCLLNAEDSLFSLVVRTDADYESLTASCFPERIRTEWLPPRPEAEEVLVYVSLKGVGCRGCLNIVTVRETSGNVEVEVEGGFQGNCDMLMVPAAWALIPRTDKPIVFQFHDAICPDERLE